MNILFWKKKTEESFGAAGEEIAVNFLKKNGWKILERNFKNPYGRRLGEIDIIAREKKEIVFVEVKTRTLTGPGDPLPEESIDRNKLRRLQKIANFYMRKNRLWNNSFRFDAVCITIDGDSGEQKIRHLRSIFI